MTLSKQKARMLLDEARLDDSWGDKDIGERIDIALLIVNNIIKTIPMYNGSLNPEWKFWDEVKTELENWI